MKYGGRSIVPPPDRPEYPSSLLRTYAAHLFSQPLTRQGLFNPFLFAGLKVERVFLYILNDIFLLDFALEAPESAFKGFAFIQNDFRQSTHLLKDERISYSAAARLSSLMNGGSRQSLVGSEQMAFGGLQMIVARSPAIICKRLIYLTFSVLPTTDYRLPITTHRRVAAADHCRWILLRQRPSRLRRNRSLRARYI